MSSKPLQLITLCCLAFYGGSSLAQSPASSVQRLNKLLQSYHSHRSNDSAYLKAVDSIVPVLLAEDSLPEWLGAYENTRAELLRTEEGRRKAQRDTMYLFTLLALLVLGGIAGFMAYRSRQRQRMLNLQLNLARNFHDEIGPMLLFANALIKKELDERPSAGLAELKVQTAQIMEAVRGIAHDLKSGQLSTVDSFGREVTALLEKIRQSTGIDFQFRLNQGGRILSHWQYTHLTKMTNELISNSIKHAGCSRINILIESEEQRLTIRYSDDGRGMEPGSFSAGIGLGNIKERVALLKGSFELRNAWPEGYSIEISIPFV
jgi:signal transduction histidine kinase